MITANELMESPPLNSEIAVARQAIYDQHLKVIGYEVLYRNGTAQSAEVDDGNRATSDVLLNTLIEIGLDQIVEQKLAFVNLTREYLLGMHPLPLGERRLVLEILENVTIDDELVDAVKHLVSQGYVLAIDDATFHEALVPLLSLASIVKVELPAIPKDELPTHVKLLRNYPVKLLAEKIESREEFSRCLQLGFDYFQGYAISRPERFEARRARACHSSVLMLLAQLNDPDVTLESLGDIVRTGPVLSVKLLRYINSSLHGCGRRIESLNQALTLLGVEKVRTIATLVMLAGATTQPKDIVKGVIQRANFCEQLGRLQSGRDSSAYFLAGLLSAADTLLEIPLPEILDSLPLAPGLKRAILDQEGMMGSAVRCATGFERLDWNAIQFDNRPASDVREALLTSIEYTERLWTELALSTN